MTPALLFAYGTLAPEAPGEASAGASWVSDAVRGRLFDLGPYPALVDLGAPGSGWVEGFVRAVDGAELSGRLDPYEGVDEGLYRRIAATTRAGRLVWVYVYAQPVPPEAKGPLTRWARPGGRPPGAAASEDSLPSQGDEGCRPLPHASSPATAARSRQCRRSGST